MSAMDLDAHPNPQPNPHHRKVDLQSSHDLTFVQSNLAQSAMQKIDLHFPKLSKPATHISLDGQDKPSNQGRDTQKPHDDGGEEEEDDNDPMRLRVRELVSEFLRATWTSAGHNISVNGIDVSSIAVPHSATLSKPPRADAGVDAAGPATTREELEGIDFQYDAFDARLQHRLAALHGELETLTAQVSKLRRTAPTAGADMYQSTLSGVMNEEEEAYRIATVQAEADEGDAVEGLELNGVRNGWNDDVRDIYGRGITELAGLSGAKKASGPGGRDIATLTETVGKVQRANRVAMEME